MTKQAKKGKTPAAPDAAADAEAKGGQKLAEVPGGPSRCAYESPNNDKPFPLRMHCIWDEKLFANDVAQGSEVPWKSCSAKGCKAVFHRPCCATASVSHGLTGVHYDTQKMFCPAHHKDMNTAHGKEQIMLKHMTLQRQAHLEHILKSKQDGGQDEAAPLATKLRVMGLICDMSMNNLLTSIPVNEGGFAQRNVASQQASQVEQLMRENSYDILAGNLAVVEIPYTDAEIKELQDADLLPKDFVAPNRLVDFEDAKDVKDGSWMINFKDSKYQMNLRRFAIIDGNNRIIALVRITAEDPDFLKNTALNAYLVDLDIHDGLAVQLASMRCNKLSHSFIEDTPGDRIFQFQCVIDIYSKTHPKVGKLSQTTVCKWIEANAKELVDLLPREVQQSGVIIDPKTKQQVTFKTHALQSHVRIATLAKKEFVTWLQQRYALHQSGARSLTAGEKKVFTHHYIKMSAVLADPDPISVLQAKADQVDRALQLSGNVKTWSVERRALYQSYYLSYDAPPMDRSKHVVAAVPVLYASMQKHLEKLVHGYTKDAELLNLIPFPLEDHPDAPLVVNLEKMRDGQRDFDIPCILWHKSQPVQQSGTKRGKTDERTFVLPVCRKGIRLHVLPTRHPRQVQ